MAEGTWEASRRGTNLAKTDRPSPPSQAPLGAEQLLRHQELLLEAVQKRHVQLLEGLLLPETHRRSPFGRFTRPSGFPWEQKGILSCCWLSLKESEPFPNKGNKGDWATGFKTRHIPRAKPEKIGKNKKRSPDQEEAGLFLCHTIWVSVKNGYPAMKSLVNGNQEYDLRSFFGRVD